MIEISKFISKLIFELSAVAYVKFEEKSDINFVNT